jgi:hypothetical protein
MKTKQYGVGLALVAALGAGGGAQAETFRCVLADRIASYQQSPCAVPDLPPPSPAAAPRPAPAIAPIGPRAADDAPFSTLTPRKREVLDLTARFERCRSEQADFAARSSDLYKAWRRRHAATLTEFSHLLSTKVRVAKPEPAACNDDWLRELEPLAHEPDARFATVEKTWQVFVGALLAADRAMVMRSVTGPVARTMAERLDKLSDADLRRMGANVKELKVLWGDDYEKEAMVLHGERMDGIVFRRNVNEEWKLREMKPAPLKAATPRRSSPDS